jgi:hypothetical protein
MQRVSVYSLRELLLLNNDFRRGETDLKKSKEDLQLRMVSGCFEYFVFEVLIISTWLKEVSEVGLWHFLLMEIAVHKPLVPPGRGVVIVAD